jgi:DNA-binding PadR family transcriptional regulator
MSMYELLVLALLMHWPLHAYRIVKMASNIIGPEERLSTGTLSTLITKLEQAGLVCRVDSSSTPFPTDRTSHAFAITSAGRERFLELMMDTTSHPGGYSRLFHIKSLHLEFLPPDKQLFLVDHYLSHCRQITRSKREDRRDVSENPLKQEHMSASLRQGAFALMKLKTEQWQLEVSWAESLREQILSNLKQHEKATSTIGERVLDN